MRWRTGLVASLLFGSGLCALVYQVTWLRELRLIFGASTAATAAVLAIFMGGLGLGGALLGPRADRTPNPLRLYARLEIGIAISAAATPAFVLLARALYVGSGGAAALGDGLATLARLALAAVVLAIPTILMGGTFPAAARAVESGEDLARRRLAVLYGCNTLGAVTGAAVATFVMLERFGNRTTLWIAALLNLAIALAALAAARRGGAEPPGVIAAEARSPFGPPDTALSRARAPFILAAAAVVGFAFFLMEIVWYRMLAPLLGGSTYTFGLILAVALAGIGIGGLLYGAFESRRIPTLVSLSGICALEALLIAIPYALGDRIAIFAILLRRLGALGFAGYVGGWTAVVSVVVLPAAIVAGFQFPLLVGLLGRGRDRVGRDAGFAYAFNTLGAIGGSLAGGFGILPLLSALGTWKLATGMLVGLSAVTLVLAAWWERARWRLVIPAIPVLLALGCFAALGPSAAWRHSPIGAGRADRADQSGSFEPWLRQQRASIAWETDGIESTVGLASDAGYAFLVNGKSDGHATRDAGTQVMSGLIGAAVHGAPRRAFVIGLGTGSTAGWLGRVPTIERVDVAELEPGILQVAAACTPVNAGVLRNPKIAIRIGDVREILLTSRSEYDVVFSEPSNPYRAGVASLFTREFYQAVTSRLAPGGIFVQWIQTYEIDPESIRTVYRTLQSVFPAVESWQSQTSDLILLGSAEPARLDADRLRAALVREPYRSAMHAAWRTESLEGFLARYVARAEFSQRLAKIEGRVNTDDRNVLEFAAARSVGQTTELGIEQIRNGARALGEDRPRVTGAVDWNRVELERLGIHTIQEAVAPVPLDADGSLYERVAVHEDWAAGRLTASWDGWKRMGGVPVSSLELAMMAEAMAEEDAPGAEKWIAALGRVRPAEAAIIRARLLWRRGDLDAMVGALEEGFVAHRRDPWPLSPIMGRGLSLAELAAAERPDLAERIQAALAEPFAVSMLDHARKVTALNVAERIPTGRCNDATLRVLESFEPWPPWSRPILTTRAVCRDQTGDPRAARARRELDRLLEREPEPLLR
ncbi:MAG TPA: fused MFS/spermidine synthase [Thermoanaerobaculia bacterium]|nr:fused MFS/spermidine synthase [Thermoanaerobaculia bacterium]